MKSLKQFSTENMQPLTEVVAESVNRSRIRKDLKQKNIDPDGQLVERMLAFRELCSLEISQIKRYKG